MVYKIPPGNPTVVWDKDKNGVITNDPYVSWSNHVARTGRGGVDMTTGKAIPLFAPMNCTVYRYSGGAGIAVRMYATDNSGWSDIFDHLTSVDVADGTTVPFGGRVATSGNTYGYAHHLHWHRLDPQGVRRIPWDYFTGAPTQQTGEDIMIYVADNNSSDGLIKAGYYYVNSAEGPLRAFSSLEGGAHIFFGTSAARWPGNDIRALVKIVGLRAQGAPQGLTLATGGAIQNDGRLTGAIVY